MLPEKCLTPHGRWARRWTVRQSPRHLEAGGRLDAAIRYQDVRTSFNTMRVVGGLAIIALSLAAVTLDDSSALIGVAVGLAIAMDGAYRRHHGESALPLVLVDTSAFGLFLVVRGHAAGIEIAVLIYVVAVSLLLLGLSRSAIALGAVALWSIVIAAVGPVAPADGVAAAQQQAYATAIALVIAAMIGQLLFIAGRSLHAAIERHRAALEAERRAGALKNEFVSMVSHELRTPLTSIAGFTDTLREAWTTFRPAEIDEMLGIMRSETEHLRELVEDILVIPRLEAGHLRLEPEELDVRRAVFASGEAVFSSEGREFVVTIPGGVSVLADPMRLSQVLRNLLENARKYGGDQVLVDGDLAGELFRVAISDNGPGVPEEDIERIFDPFEQLTKGDARSDEGIGLGLPIARRLVDAMGGELWYESRFPIGARFCFTLPLARISREAQQMPDSVDAAQRSPETVN